MKLIDLVLVDLSETGNPRGVFEAPYASTTVGDTVTTADGISGTVKAVESASVNDSFYRMIRACFGNPDIPKLKGKTEYHESRYKENPHE